MQSIQKFLCLLLAICFVLSLASCGVSINKEKETANTTRKTVTTKPKTTKVPATTKESGIVPITGSIENINIMTFNIWYKNDSAHDVKETSEKADLRINELRGPKFLKLLEGEQIDIAGLQEAAPIWQEFLKNNLPEKYSLIGKQTVKTKEAGYILYNNEKFELLENGTYWLADGAPESYTMGWDASLDRIVNWAVFKCTESDVIFLFCNTHFDAAGSLAKIESAILVCNKIDEKIKNMKKKYGIDHVPAFLVGDLNSEPDSAGYDEMCGKMFDSRKYAEGVSVPDSLTSSPGLLYIEKEKDLPKNGHFIDHIFFKGSAYIHYVKMELTGTNLCQYGEYMSDHNAVIANISISNEVDKQ